VYSVKYELGSYIPEDDILHSHRRETLRPYIAVYSSPTTPMACLPAGDRSEQSNGNSSWIHSLRQEPGALFRGHGGLEIHPTQRGAVRVQQQGGSVVSRLSCKL
jgi:hypothetical protein